MDRYRVGVTLFLVAALASFLLSIGLWFSDNHDESVSSGCGSRRSLRPAPSG